MAQIKFKPIERWPHEPTKNRQRSRFDSTYTATLKLLNSELDHLNAKDVLIHLWLGFGQIKNDGTPYADARPTQPGVIVSFTGKHGAVEMACDEYDQWRDNLRAIALSLEALRKVDRYGCSKKGQQYRGWKALPPAPEDHPMREQAETLRTYAGNAFEAQKIATDREVFDQAWAMAVHRTHPDKGGTTATFQAVIRARDEIRAFNKWV